MARKKRSKTKKTKPLKKTGTYKGKSNKLGGGGRFAQLKDRLKKKGYSDKSAAAIAAAVGRKKYGAKKMAKWSAKGRKRKKRRK